MDNPKNWDAGGKKTLVEEGTQFKGSLTSSCPIVVRGKIEGDISAPSLQISATGAVSGKVKVGEMHSQGELAGEFDAETVQLSGIVRDKTIVRAKSLEVKLLPTNNKMQVVFGECTLDVGEMPSKEAAVHSAIAPKEAEKPAVAIANGSSPPPANGKNAPAADEVMPAIAAEAAAERSRSAPPPKRP